MGSKSNPIVTFEDSQNLDLRACRQVNQSRFGKPTFNEPSNMLRFAKKMARNLALSPVKSAVFYGAGAAFLQQFATTMA